MNHDGRRSFSVWVYFLCSSSVGFLQLPPTESSCQLGQINQHILQILEAARTVFKDFSDSF